MLTTNESSAIQQLIADEIMHATYRWAAGRWHSTPPSEDLAKAVLSSPAIMLILDLAARVTKMTPEIDRWMSDAEFHHAVTLLLNDWNSKRV